MQIIKVKPKRSMILDFHGSRSDFNVYISSDVSVSTYVVDTENKKLFLDSKKFKSIGGFHTDQHVHRFLVSGDIRYGWSLIIYNDTDEPANVYYDVKRC